MVFHWSLSDKKSPQVSRTLLSILSDLKNAVVWMVSTSNWWSFTGICVTISLFISTKFFQSIRADINSFRVWMVSILPLITCLLCPLSVFFLFPFQELQLRIVSTSTSYSTTFSTLLQSLDIKAIFHFLLFLYSGLLER